MHPQDCSFSIRLALWLAGSLVGGILVALPDDDARIFSLSRTHGPSAVDLLGIGLLILAWLPIAALLWAGRGAIRGTYAAGFVLLALSGLLVLTISIAGDTGREWMFGALLLGAAQIIGVMAIWRSSGPRSR